MNYNVLAIDDKKLKYEITDGVLRALPDWFGIEEAIIDYVQKSQDMRFWAAYVVERPVVFLLSHNAQQLTVFVVQDLMGTVAEWVKPSRPRSVY